MSTLCRGRAARNRRNVVETESNEFADRLADGDELEGNGASAPSRCLSRVGDNAFALLTLLLPDLL
jgi:hypothetical protein